MADNAVLVYDRTRSKRALGFRRGSYRLGGLSKPANYTKCHDKCCRKHSTHPVPPLRATLLDFTPQHLKVNRCNASVRVCLAQRLKRRTRGVCLAAECSNRIGDRAGAAVVSDCAYRKVYPARMLLKSATSKKVKRRPLGTTQDVIMLHCSGFRLGTGHHTILSPL